MVRFGPTGTSIGTTPPSCVSAPSGVFEDSKATRAGVEPATRTRRQFVSREEALAVVEAGLRLSTDSRGSESDMEFPNGTFLRAAVTPHVADAAKYLRHRLQVWLLEGSW